MSFRVRLYLALLLATAVAGVLATSVAVSFRPWRMKVVESPLPPNSGVVAVDVPATSAPDTIEAPLALIARIRNESASDERVSFRIDGVEVCTSSILRTTSKRIDCTLATGWAGAVTHSISISGAMQSWTLEYLEIATHEGATRDYDLIVLPRLARRFGRVDAAWIAISWVAVALLFLVPCRAPRAATRRLYRACAAVVALFFVLVVISPYLSPYLVVLSPRCVLAALCLVLMPQIWSAYRYIPSGAASTGIRHSVGFACALALVAGSFGAVLANRLSDNYGR